MEFEYGIAEYGSDSFRGNRFHDGEEVDHFGKSVYDDKDGVLAFGLREGTD